MDLLCVCELRPDFTWPGPMFFEGVYLGLPHVEPVLKCDTSLRWWGGWHTLHKLVLNAKSISTSLFFFFFFQNVMFTFGAVYSVSVRVTRKQRGSTGLHTSPGIQASKANTYCYSGRTLMRFFFFSVPMQLTIIFKNFQECVDQKMYHAETDELPAAFADGSKNGGDRHGANTLRVVEKVPGQHVEIQARYIGTTIVVRQVGRYLTFAVRMPEEVVNSVEEGDNQDLYLCLHGCPANQRINFSNFRAGASEAHSAGRTRSGSGAHGFTYQSAKAKCKERLPVEDLYFQSCVFDLLSSGDINFTMAAYYAFEDVKMLHSNSKSYHIFEKDAFKSNAAQRDLLSVLLLNFLAVLLWIECCTVHP